MYLRKLYYFNKFLFFSAILFICCQLYINAKVGVVATPFLHYGMYASKANVPASVEVWEIDINNKKIDFQKFNPKTVDNIMEPLIKFNNLQYEEGITYQSKRFLTAVSLPFTDANFHSSLTKKQFDQFYTKHLSSVLNIFIKSLKVYKSNYDVKGSSFTQTSKTLFIYATN